MLGFFPQTGKSEAKPELAAFVYQHALSGLKSEPVAFPLLSEHFRIPSCLSSDTSSPPALSAAHTPSDVNSWNGFFPSADSPPSTPVLRPAVLPVPAGKKPKKPSKICKHPSGCSKYSQGGSKFCIAHGGGRKCTFPCQPPCRKAAQGNTSFCLAHHGGRRCEVAGCSRAARGNTARCCGHGGGARCKFPGCPRSAQRPSEFCCSHGGRRCAVPGCGASLRRAGGSKLCERHAAVEPLLSRMGVLDPDSSQKPQCFFL